MEQCSSPNTSPQRRGVLHSLSISSSITARSPIIYVSTTKSRRPKNPFMNDTDNAITGTSSVSSNRK
ncbi:unnamed protein product [Cercopithifilaria johnstoni]|uniref:Uncharacterized protein n=1 Tax=Cercopithifilaria johnstoni TaxID=2874296 RepID=A0A8J2Q8Q7_9BILA|nr:unnamed protein product [Cercopithifilaria johnstoni]